MPLTERELLARDAKRDIGAELLQSAREMNAGLGKVAYRIKVPNAAALIAMAEAEAEAEKITQSKSASLKARMKSSRNLRHD
jgi:hypothetical protein